MLTARALAPIAGAFFGLLLAIYLLASSLPPLDVAGEGPLTVEEIGLPRTLDDAKLVASLLQRHRVEHLGRVILLFGAVYIFKQAFSIPGSAILNLLAGALFGVPLGWPLCCVLTVAGASCCYGMSALLGDALARPLFGAERIQRLQDVISKQHQDSNLFFFCLFSRLFPFTPNFFLNLASPVAGVPYTVFAGSVLLGLMPYNFLTVKAGTLLARLGSVSDAIDTETMVWMAVIACIALVPVLFRSKLTGLSPMADATSKSKGA